MTIFTIDSENNIVAHHAQSEITDKEAEQFSSEKELVGLAADWPGNRLVEVWNGIPGLTRVKRFTSRRLAIGRIWKAVQSLGSGESSGEVGSKRGHEARKPARNQHAHTARKYTKQSYVVALLKRSSGATLHHLMPTTASPPPTAPGFISASLRK